MAEIKTVADVRRMRRGETQDVSPAPAPIPEPDPEPAAPVPSGLSDLGLTDEQVEALEAAGFTDRDALRAAGNDSLMAVRGVGRVTVNNLRRALGGGI